MISSDTGFLIGDTPVGEGAPAFLIAEVAQAHDGSLGFAHAFIDAAAEAGVDAVKFQTHIADAESTRDEQFRIRFSRQDATRYDYWKRMEFTAEQWSGLAAHAAERGLVFLSSAFSVAAVELLDRLRMPAWKVGSGEFRSQGLIDSMLATKRPILLSNGMSTYAETAAAVERVRRAGAPILLFQCTSKYPTRLEEVGLNVLDEYRQRFGVPIGLSDHSGTVWPSIAALARGIDMIEVHLTFDRRMFGPDVSSSLTVDEMRKIVEARSAFRVMDAHPVDKDQVADAMSTMRSLFTKSLALVCPLPKGVVLTSEMLTEKKPGTGIPLSKIGDVIGRTLAHDVPSDRLLTWEDLSNAS